MVAGRGTRRPKNKSARQNKNKVSHREQGWSRAQKRKQQAASKLVARERAHARRARREMRARHEQQRQQRVQAGAGGAEHTKAHGQAAEGSAVGPGSAHLYKLTTRNRMRGFAQRVHLALLQ